MGETLWWCQSCGETGHRGTAAYCRRCGARLVRHYDLPPTTSPAPAPSGWKSVPAPIRFGIWLIVIPPLLWFGCAACTVLGGLTAALGTHPHP
jgi:hypothetical protein